MKKAFTLIELIFVIVIIGVLASVAVPKFKNLTTHAKSSGVKSVVTSVQSSIDNIHGKWIINDNMTSFKDSKGNSHSLNSQGYPEHLDGNNGKYVFDWVLKTPIPVCAQNKTNGCWKEEQADTYAYYYNTNKVLKLEYNATSGTLECIDGVGITKEECEQIIY